MPTRKPPPIRRTPIRARTQEIVRLAVDFDALVHATRWTALTPFIPPSGDDNPEDNSTSSAAALPIAAPFFGAVQVDDFQLVPLLKALQMPRIALLLADDVGLGKTVEAGLILTELLIRRVLILTPASLRRQWQQEMKDKFALPFEGSTGPKHMPCSAVSASTPTRGAPIRASSPRTPTCVSPMCSNSFARPASSPRGAYELPWDLLIVDEAHNLMPSSFGPDSDLSQMLAVISPWFEHKLFLTATPHNGHTRSFSGLLERLDPVRFSQTSEFTEAERRRACDVVVRRLKSEINALDDQLGRPRRFAERYLEPLPLYFARREKQLAAAFQAFRAAVKSAIARAQKSEQLAGSFAVEVLNKRLLSCPLAFADSWFRFKQGLADDESTAG